MNFQCQDNIFEIIGENQIHPLDTSLNVSQESNCLKAQALANIFKQFDYEPGQFEFEYKFAFPEESDMIILTTNGKLVSDETQSDFILSAKILIDQPLIKHIKLKIN